MMSQSLNVKVIEGIECYEKDGVVYLKLETVARGLGFTKVDTKISETGFRKEYTSIRWERVFGFLDEIGFDHKWAKEGFSPEVGKDSFIPENIFYRLAMKAKNEVAERFQAKIADEIIPSIRKQGYYAIKPITDPMEMLQLHYNVLEKHNEVLKEVSNRLEEVEMNQRLKWRDQMMSLVRKHCNRTGMQQSVFLGQKVYPELERRTGRSLDRTLKERRKRMEKQGFTFKSIREFYKIDLIESDKRLRITFEQILKEF